MLQVVRQEKSRSDRDLQENEIQDAGTTYQGNADLHRWKTYLAVACLYAGITALFTYPQITSLTTAFAESPIGSSSDQNIVMWDAWWAKKSLVDLKTNPFFTRYLYYPNGSSLALHALTFLNGVATIPFQVLMDKPKGLILGCNIVIFLTFVITGVGMYALTRSTGASREIAFFAGIALAFCPYRTMHIVHTDLLSMGWIAIYMLFLLKTLREKSLLNPVLGGIVFCVTVLTCDVYAFFLLLLTALFVMYTLLFDRKRLTASATLFRFLALFLLVLTVLIPKLLAIMRSGSAEFQPEWTLEILSANPVGYVIPSHKHLLYRFLFDLLPDFKYYISGVPGHATFLTFTVIALAIIAIFKFRLRVIGFWLTVFLVFAVLSLGPRLHFYKWSTAFPLPYLLLYKWMPLFGVIRTPYRFVVLAEMGAIILACYGLTYITTSTVGGGERKDGPSMQRPGIGNLLRHAIPIGFSLLLLIELWNVPFRRSVVPVPSIYTAIAEEEGEFAILDLPASKHSHLNRYMYYQTLHEKPIPTGAVSRVDPALREFLEDLLPTSSVPTELDSQEAERLRQNGIKYVIYHRFEDDLDDIYFVLKLF